MWRARACLRGGTGSAKRPRKWRWGPELEDEDEPHTYPVSDLLLLRGDNGKHYGARRADAAQAALGVDKDRPYVYSPASDCYCSEYLNVCLCLRRFA